jgi:hypothetical protein
MARQCGDSSRLIVNTAHHNNKRPIIEFLGRPLDAAPLR